MHNSTKKTFRLFVSLLVAAQCSIVEAKRVDRRIVNPLSAKQPKVAASPAKRAPVSAAATKGRDLVNGLPVATGLEVAGIYGTPTTGLPGSGAHVVAPAPTSCMPGSPNCMMPPSIQANPNVTPSPSMWPLLLQAGLPLMKSLFGGGGGGSGTGSGSSKAGTGQRSGADSLAPSGSGGEASLPPLPLPRRPSTNAPLPSDGEPNRRVDGSVPKQPLLPEADQQKLNPQDPQGGRVFSAAIPNPQVSTSATDVHGKPMTTLKHTGDEIKLFAPIGGNIEVKSSPIPDNANEIMCEKVLSLMKVTCMYCKMTVRYKVAKNPTGDAKVNSCQNQTTTVPSGQTLVSLGAKSGVTEVDMSISDPRDSRTASFLPTPGKPNNSVVGQPPPTSPGAEPLSKSGRSLPENGRL